jgi:GNAT superfamily N-acetyltransferase
LQWRAEGVSPPVNLHFIALCASYDILLLKYHLPVTYNTNQIELAIETFVRGFCAGKSVTHPYDFFRVGKIWVMRDAPRKNPKNYRKEEWIAYGVEPAEVDAAARQGGTGILPVLHSAPQKRRFFICAIRSRNDPDEPVRTAYKSLGYRLLATEPLFIHRLQRIPRLTSDGIEIDQVRTAELAACFGKASRSRPIPAELLGKDAPFRQYVALSGDKIVGWVRSIHAGTCTWCSNMYVAPSHRRRGIGSALLARMLRDDRRLKFRQSVLLASHAGALLYPRLGYEQIGLLYMFAPRR